jgi:hypothetical protein
MLGHGVQKPDSTLDDRGRSEAAVFVATGSPTVPVERNFRRPPEVADAVIAQGPAEKTSGMDPLTLSRS